MQWLYVLLVLACPLMMIFMMRGMHGGRNEGRAGHAGCHGGSHGAHQRQESLEDLRARRDSLDLEIEARERAELEPDQEPRLGTPAS